MKQYQIKSHRHFLPEMATFEVAGKSITVPGMALQIEKAVERFRRGEEIATLTGVYTSDYGIDVEEFEKMDLLQKLHWASENRVRLQEQQDAINEMLRQQENENQETDSEEQNQTEQ